MGATALCEVPTGDIIVGGGDGSICVLRTAQEPSPANPKVLKKMAKLASAKLEGAVTSIVLDEVVGRSFTFLVGTAACNMYKITYEPVTNKWVAAGGLSPARGSSDAVHACFMGLRGGFCREFMCMGVRECHKSAQLHVCPPPADSATLPLVCPVGCRTS